MGDKEDFIESGLQVKKGERFTYFSNDVPIEEPSEELSLIILGQTKAEEQEDIYLDFGDYYDDYGDESGKEAAVCDETCADEPPECGCNYIGISTDVNVRFLCTTGDVC